MLCLVSFWRQGDANGLKYVIAELIMEQMEKKQRERWIPSKSIEFYNMSPCFPLFEFWYHLHAEHAKRELNTNVCILYFIIEDRIALMSVRSFFISISSLKMSERLMHT